jgi:endonuclease/exonuclease/phosphatase family metal-dependent hydrolase
MNVPRNRLASLTVVFLTMSCAGGLAESPGSTDGSPDLPLTIDGQMQPSDAIVPDQNGSPPDMMVADSITPQKTWRVATLNCYCLKDSPNRRAKGIAAEIAKLNPHAVGLQEVCQSINSDGLDNFANTLIAELKTLTATDWEYRFVKSHVAWDAYDEGLGLLARKGTIKASGEASLAQGQGLFPRKVQWAEITSGVNSFYVYNTHLTLSAVSQDRVDQVNTILSTVNQHSGAGISQVVLGDFNAWYGSAAVETIKFGPPQFTDAWGEKHPGSTTPGFTCCTPNYDTRIDYIFVRNAKLQDLLKLELSFSGEYGGIQISDHIGLSAEFAYP